MKNKICPYDRAITCYDYPNCDGCEDYNPDNEQDNAKENRVESLTSTGNKSTSRSFSQDYPALQSQKEKEFFDKIKKEGGFWHNGQYYKISKGKNRREK